MSKKDPGRIYVDACIAIELAKRVMNIQRPDREHDLWFVRQMLKASENGEIELITSSFTVVESLHLGRDAKNNVIECPENVREFLVNLLTSGRLIKLVQPSLFVAERARDLRWANGLKLKPADSLHVASALDSECQELITFDGKIDKQPDELSTIRKLGVRVIFPSESLMLPENYRQDTLGLEAPPINKQLPGPPVQ